MWVVSDIVIPEDRDSAPVSNDDRPERWKPPDNQIPVTVPFQIVLARTAELAVFVQDARVYLTAVDLRLTVLFRTTQNEPLPPPSPIRPGTFIGVEYADGRRAVLGLPIPVPPPPEPGPDEPALFITGATATGRRCFFDLLLTPIPRSGPLIFHFSAGGHGIDDLAATVDAAPLAHAASQAVELWPPTPGPDFPPRTAPKPVAPPANSWFEK